MYAVMRMLGANIWPSGAQTAMGKNMWAKWKKHSDVKHLTSMNAKIDQPGVAEGKLVESAVFLNPTTVVVGQAHGQPLELSPNTLKQIQAIAAKHGAWYEGNGTDRGYTKGQIDRYVGSWDDEVAKTADSNDPKWIYVLFANVDENNRVQRVGIDPNDTIFNRLLDTAKDNSFQGIGYTSQALQKFLQMASEGKYDFLKMSQQPATQENLTRFLKAGEALMWPKNWKQYPNKAGKIAKAATVDVRDQYLATRKAGVYVTGIGHLTAVQNITGKQGVAEGLFDRFKKKLTANRGGIDLTASKEGGRIIIDASSQGKRLGIVMFNINGKTLVADRLMVQPEYRGQGIAEIMYDWAKGLGYTVQRSSDQTDDGKRFWDKLKGEETNVWEQGVTENFADGKGPGRPGDSQRHGIPKNATMAELEKASHAKGRKGQLARWQLNMRRGRKK
jgi:GNAT superfamily N-acetyltransferase